MSKLYDRVLRISLHDEKAMEKTVKAFDCRARRNILRLLSKNSYTIWEIAKILDMPISSASEHVKVLADSGLVTVFGSKNNGGRGKTVAWKYGKVIVDVTEENSQPISDTKRHNVTYQIPIGSYTDFYINRDCGIVGAEGCIGCQDNKDSFYSPIRSSAQLIWFDCGYLEYSIPLLNREREKIVSMMITLELCSEAPDYNEKWKSDIYFEINGKEVCLYTALSDFGARPGKLTPPWWGSGMTQYGLLKCIEVTEEGTFLDKVLVSSVTVDDLEFSENSVTKLRIGVRENAKNRGGLNLFGKKFGDYPQHIDLTVTYEY